MAEPTKPRTSSASRPNVVVLVVVGVVVLALVAVVISMAGGGDDDDTSASAAAETRDVEVVGADLALLEDPADDPAIGEAAPVLHGETFEGEEITIPGNGPAVVVFLAHWCPHCQREVPVLVDHFGERGMPEDVDVFGVATSIDPASPNYPPSAWLDGEDWEIPTLFDSEDDAAARAYGLSAFPYFVVLDAEGDVVMRTSGELDPPQLEALLDAARGE